MAHLGASPASRIADVGCGGGRLLRELHRLGFRDLTGVDPNIPADIMVDDRLRVRKQFLEELPGKFDVIMFHHSLEHIPDQLGVLEAAHTKLADGGACLIRIPLVSSHAWHTYGTSWVQLDAPRHLFLHSEQSMRLLAERVGFQVEKVVYDSNEFQFWGSEVLRQGDALVDPATGQLTAASTAMVRRNAKQWRREAAALNARGEGDQAAFILRKVADGRAAAH
jgi:SAM-dependent methyltransferase